MGGKYMFLGEEWQLNSKASQCRSMERSTDRIKIDLSWGKSAPIKEISPIVKRVNPLQQYKDKGARKTVISWRGGEQTIFRLLTVIECKRMFPTKVVRTITYIK